jgi:hypothetical protein
MPSDSHLDRRVSEAVALATRDAPTDLVLILNYVDSREKLVLSREELVGALERLIARGEITEVTPLHFAPAAGSQGSRSFSGVSSEQYQSACDTYTERFWAEYRKLVHE